MVIGIDASRALKPIKTGTEWYSVEIIRHLAAIDQKNQYILYSNKTAEPPLDNLPDNFKWRVMPFPRGWTLIRLSMEMRKNPPDVLFIPAHTLPLVTPAHSVVVVHDLGYKHFPELYPKRQIMYHNFVIKQICDEATHIITPSEFVKQDLSNLMKFPLEKITAIHHGYDKNLYQPRRNPSHASADHQPYIFYIGRLETKKNIVNLIEAFRLLRSSSLNTKYEILNKVKLVLAGRPSHGYDKISQTLSSLGNLRQDVIELGYIPQEEVPYWLSNASVFAFPTSFEGFGFPVIEAMACGVPVVSSNTTSIPEIAGDAALLVDPTNSQAIADALAKVLVDKDASAELITRGYKQVEQFNWQKCAEETLAIIEKTYASKSATTHTPIVENLPPTKHPEENVKSTFSLDEEKPVEKPPAPLEVPKVHETPTQPKPSPAPEENMNTTFHIDSTQQIEKSPPQTAPTQPQKEKETEKSSSRFKIKNVETLPEKKKPAEIPKSAIKPYPDTLPSERFHETHQQSKSEDEDA